MRINKPIILLLVSAALLAVCGCTQPQAKPPVMRHFLSSPQDVLSVSRVVFVELSEDIGYPRQAQSMTDEICKALNSKDFHVDKIRLSDPRCRDLPLKQIDAFSIQQLQQMREDLRCEAVLFGRVTQFQPYPKLQTAVYLKLLNLRDGKLIWAMDAVWDTTEKETERRVKYFFENKMRSGYGPDRARLALMSPRMFQKYVAWEVARTIPTRRELYAPVEQKERNFWTSASDSAKKILSSYQTTRQYE